MGDNERNDVIEFLIEWDMKRAGGLTRDQLLETLEMLLNDAYWAETDEYLQWLHNERKGA